MDVWSHIAEGVISRAKGLQARQQKVENEQVVYSCRMVDGVLYSCRLRDVHPLAQCPPVWGQVWARETYQSEWRAATLLDVYCHTRHMARSKVLFAYTVYWRGTENDGRRPQKLFDVTEYDEMDVKLPSRALCVFRHIDAYSHPITGKCTKEAAWSTVLVLETVLPEVSSFKHLWLDVCRFAGVLDLRLFGPGFKLTKTTHCTWRCALVKGACDGNAAPRRTTMTWPYLY